MVRFNAIMATVIDGLIKAFGMAVPENVTAAHHVSCSAKFDSVHRRDARAGKSGTTMTRRTVVGARRSDATVARQGKIREGVTLRITAPSMDRALSSAPARPSTD